VEKPCATIDGGNGKVQSSAENGLEQVEHKTMVVEVDSTRKPLQDTMTGVDRTASNVKFKVQWVNQVMYVEEEPWTEDFHAT